jgi:hypothetical protein
MLIHNYTHTLKQKQLPSDNEDSWRIERMNDQEIRAKALECAIATYKMLPEDKRNDAIKRNVSSGMEVFQMVEKLADLYCEYIKT